MGYAKMKSNTTTYQSDIEDFLDSWEAPLVRKVRDDGRYDLYIDDSSTPTISFIFGDGAPKIYIHDEEFNGILHHNFDTNILLVAYSDTFFHFWIYGGYGYSQLGSNKVRLNYFYEKIGKSNFEGYSPRDGVWYECSVSDHIYNCTMFDSETGAAYVHKNWMNYAGNDNTIDSAPDFLFQFNTASEFDSPDLIVCTTVPRHQVVVFDEQEYFSLEEHLLIPLFNEGDDSSDTDDSEDE